MSLLKEGNLLSAHWRTIITSGAILLALLLCGCDIAGNPTTATATPSTRTPNPTGVVQVIASPTQPRPSPITAAPTGLPSDMPSPLHPENTAPPSAPSRPTTTTVAPTPPGCNPQWSIVSSPNASTKQDNDLHALAALAPTDVWAVGVSDWSNDAGSGQALIEHWNGSAWSIVPSPNVGTVYNVFDGVAAVSSGDIWAVGRYWDNDSSSPSQTLAEHWNGTQWSVARSPNVGTKDNFLHGVAAVSSNDVWAVGLYWDGSGYQTAHQIGDQTLVEHWDGNRWSVVPSPNPNTFDDRLYGVAAVSSSDVWAVGYYESARGFDILIEHWDGSKWNIVPGPDVGTTENTLMGVAAVSSNDVWAVGYHSNGPSALNQTLTLHWNGRKWSVVPSPNIASSRLVIHNYLNSVAAVSSDSVWAAGSYGSPLRTLVEHWNGTQWSIVPSPNVGTYNYLNGVAAWGSYAWAVGSGGSGDTPQTLVEQYMACHIVASSNADNTAVR